MAERHEGSLLSTKDIPPQERLIFALDFPNHDKALAMVRTLGDSVVFYKLGLELFMAGNYFELADQLIAMDKKIFVDLKFFDVPETVAAAVRGLKDRGVHFATVHGNGSMLKAAVGEKNGLKILAVTVLTSLDQSDLNDFGFQVSVEDLVLSRARRALEVGCDGVISSGLEAPRLREELGERFLIVAPGIRPVYNDFADDHKRPTTPEDAFLSGADYIVMGRPIKFAPDPRAAAEKVQETIRSLFP